jgi:predicted XRE-type DNA-binding protein
MKLKEIIKKHALSQTEIAKQIKMSRVVFNYKLQGTRKFTNVDKIKILLYFQRIGKELSNIQIEW